MVLDGEITVTTEQGTVTLGAYDSVHIAPKEVRTVVNNGNHVCTMLVIVSNNKVAP
jgi:quercetin dioxygenase-like cupin family protein